MRKKIMNKIDLNTASSKEIIEFYDSSITFFDSIARPWEKGGPCGKNEFVRWNITGSIMSGYVYKSNNLYKSDKFWNWIAECEKTHECGSNFETAEEAMKACDEWLIKSGTRLVD